MPRDFCEIFDNRLTGISAQGQKPVQSLGLAYNGVHNITSITDSAANDKGKNQGLSHSQSFAYDALSRLLAANGAYGQQSFAYDANGNRTAATENTASSAYAYASASNRLLGITGAGAENYTYDAAGNLATSTNPDPRDWQAQTFTYDSRNRLSAITSRSRTESMTATYAHNALGERVRKSARGHTDFIYDLAGNLIAEANNGGHIQKEYVYLDGLLVAMIGEGNIIYYIHTDHLGQPQKLTDARQNVVWEHVADPFGKTVSITGNSNLMNLRFPGQYFDVESGLNYNMHRTYDPATGRYTQSDPIGLLGGLNTYGYVGQNPVNGIDPYGLYGWYDFQMDYSAVEIAGLQGLAGFSDALTFGATNWARNQLGTNYADPLSTAYQAGEWVPAVLGGARLAYAGLTKTVSLLPSISGRDAVSIRNTLKTKFRVGFFSDYKMYTYDQMFAKYGTDEAVKAAAGRTNPMLNVFGAAAIGGFIVNGDANECQANSK